MKSKKSGYTKPRKTRDSVVLVVLDGWGIAQSSKFNAITLARKPHFDSLLKEFGSAQICASGSCVGLTKGQMGNSEVGHLTIGAGRIIMQDIVRINESIKSGKLANKSKLLVSLRAAKERNATVHFLGLLSDGGVHSHIEHLFALLDIAKNQGVENIVVHAFLDGRDTPPRSGASFLLALKGHLTGSAKSCIGTISGRYYAMDRDNRWKRTKLAYDAIVYAIGDRFSDPVAAVRKSYDKGVNDEFFVPMVNKKYAGIADGDVLFFFNFRPDRALQLAKALSMNEGEFANRFDRNEAARPKGTDMITMTVYDPKLKHVKALFPRERVITTLSNVLGTNHIRQLRIAETEKYAHVTYFFNGLVEKPMKFERRDLVPSQKIGTYDKRPEMSARKIASLAVKAITKGTYRFILINFANADMVGHSGKVKPTIKAVETVDECLGMIVDSWKKKSDELTLIVTADHGNAEKMYDEKTRQPFTAHTSNPVPLIVISKRWRIAPHANIGLRDIAPTVLKIMGIRKPSVMTGRPVVSRLPEE